MESAAPITDGSLVFRAAEGGIEQSWSGDDGTPLTLNPSGWSEWRKKTLTRAARIPGPFTVETSEGPLRCEDGWLAIDARGYPYPIADEEFQKIYERCP